MKKLILATAVAIGALTLGGCAVTGGQQSTGAYVDDATITTQVKSRMADDPTVSAMRISVETLNGTVQLSGFAANEAEKARAAQIARDVNNVREVRNNIIVRPAQ